METLLKKDTSYFIDLYKATILASHDTPPQNADAIFIFCRTETDDKEIFPLCKFLYHAGEYNHIVISGGEKGFHGFAGWQEWKEKLIDCGIPEEKIIVLPAARHTKEEADLLIEKTEKEGWETIVFIAHAHQILRCFLSLLGSFNTSAPGRKSQLPSFYACCPHNTHWDEIVYGSQGGHEVPRHEHILEELQRIPIYQEKGDLCSFEDLFNYLMMRRKKEE